MKIKHYILSLLAIATLGTLTSCDDHEYAKEETKYRVGDIVLIDGSIVHVEDFDKETQQAAAVIYDNNAQNKYPGGGYAVMVKETDLLLFADTLITQGTTADSVNVEAYNGYTNTISLSTSKDKVSSPLAKATQSFFPLGQSTFIPCLYEFQMMYRVKDIVNNSLKAVGGTEIGNNYYWTSSEVPGATDSRAWTINMSSGRTLDALKNETCYATRPVIKINETLKQYSD